MLVLQCQNGYRDVAWLEGACIYSSWLRWSGSDDVRAGEPRWLPSCMHTALL